MGTKNIIGDLKLNGSRVLTVDDQFLQFDEETGQYFTNGTENDERDIIRAHQIQIRSDSETIFEDGVAVGKNNEVIITQDGVRMPTEDYSDCGLVLDSTGVQLLDSSGCNARICNNPKVATDTDQPALTVYDTNYSTETAYGPSKIVYSVPNDDWSDTVDYSLNFPYSSGTLATQEYVNGTVGDISAALDELLSYALSLIEGEQT